MCIGSIGKEFTKGKMILIKFTTNWYLKYTLTKDQPNKISRLDIAIDTIYHFCSCVFTREGRDIWADYCTNPQNFIKTCFY